MSDNIDGLAQLANTFFEKGEPYDSGCNENQIDHFLAKSRLLDPTKPVCIVKDWTWCDLDTTADEFQQISAFGLQAVIIKSDFVIKDEACRFDYGNWVRTSYLKEFHFNCLFETQNTVYLLVGDGTRKAINSDQLKRFF